MKVKNLILIILCLCALGWSACELTLDIQLPREPRTLVLTGVLNPDSSVRIFLSQDRGALDTTKNFEPVYGAKATLFEEDQEIGKLAESTNFPTPNLGVAVYSIDHKPIPGKKYRIEVEKSGFKSISATEQLPTDASVTEFVALTCGECKDIEASNTANINMKIKIKDKVGPDYYEITGNIHQRQPIFWGIYDEDGMLLSVESPSDTNVFPFAVEASKNLVFESFIQDNLIFEDKLFDGSDYEINLTGQPYLLHISDFLIDEEIKDYLIREDIDLDTDPKIELVVLKVSENYYKHFRSIDFQNYNSEDPFAIPVQVFSNVKNGKGILGSYITSSIIMDLDF